MKVIKSNGKRVKAYQLGTKHPVLEQLIEEGKIVVQKDGSYRVLSQETANGEGELALAGDYIKLDSRRFPYPNSEKFFHKNHRWIEGDEYEQVPRILEAWTVNEPMCEEIQYLIQKKRLEIHDNDVAHYFSAFLWGTREEAGKDAVIVFYNIRRSAEGQIEDVDFNFVCRDEFEKTYSILE